MILGGGMAGLTTAWELTSGAWRDRFESVTVYQRGWRLGGKGASSRGEHGRVEEHGLHVLLGYYDATFRVLREVYGELDRATTDPGCPISTWRDAFVPSGDVGLVDVGGPAGPEAFVTRFTGDGRLPGEPGAEDRPLRPLDVAVRGLRLLADFHGVTGARARPTEPYLSTSPRPRGAAAVDPGLAVRAGALTSLAALTVLAERAAALLGSDDLDEAWSAPLTTTLVTVRDELRATVRASPAAWRTWELVDLVSTTLLGMLADGLLSGQGYERIDHLDYREWLALHGAAPTTLDSPVVRGMYDLALAYEGGDRSRPRFAAGLGLQLAGRMLFDAKGAVFWRMQAGMGDVVFAPLYQALVRRGVRFRFFRRLDQVHLGPDGRRVASVDLARQADLAPGRVDYEPLVRHHGLPCWPAGPVVSQLDGDPGPDLETHPAGGAAAPGVGRELLEAGRDFDVAVLAVSLGMVPHVAAELLDRIPAWGAMCREVATVATMSAQLWLEQPESALGWQGPAGVTLSGFGDTFDTWASMPHLLVREDWPAPAPQGLAYFCGTMPDVPDHATGERHVRQTLTRFLDDQVRVLWPAAADGAGFRWELLHDGQGRVGPDRLDAQYLRANTDPSDRYVQSLPGSGRHRMAPGATGVANLVVAGDWTACGLDAGCLEAAVRSGVLAARAVRAATLGGPAGGDVP
ncbi:NAD(P)-binding protein [Ornithinimicrobium pekingense]|uniref:NAD(P)-binding protein n=1 Tax=Ornithinimicrobium pekingense TaxID=384677 RepID=UPI000405160E|nr:NAD(P)-binding protein [Ornithinimicrobium pekingense]